MLLMSSIQSSPQQHYHVFWAGKDNLHVQLLENVVVKSLDTPQTCSKKLATPASRTHPNRPRQSAVITTPLSLPAIQKAKRPNGDMACDTAKLLETVQTLYPNPEITACC